MAKLGLLYPRDRGTRQRRLNKLHKLRPGALDALDDLFFQLIETEAGGFKASADRYAAKIKP
jgi:hypothetical protein